MRPCWGDRAHWLSRHRYRGHGRNRGHVCLHDQHQRSLKPGEGPEPADSAGFLVEG